MSYVLPSRVADAKLAEKDAWRRYAEARGDNWREVLAEWVKAREARWRHMSTRLSACTGELATYSRQCLSLN